MNEAGAIRVILLGDDGSDGAASAINFTAALAAPLEANVVLVKAYSPLDELGKAKPPVDFSRLEADAQRYLEEIRGAPLQEAGVVVRAVLVENPHAIDVLARMADEVAADLVVVGSHGETGWRARILGNVANALPHRVRCPVTIVPASQT